MNDRNRIHWLALGWSGFGLMLFLSTWPLWAGTAQFPRVPFLRWEAWQGWSAIDITGSAVLLLTLVAVFIKQIIGRPWRRTTVLELHSTGLAHRSMRLHCITLVIVILGNQHHLQPWAYLAAIMGWVMATSRPRMAVCLLRILLISVYVYSAFSKLDYQFVHTLGHQFLQAVFHPFGVSIDAWTPMVRTAGVLVFPFTELFVAVGIAIPRTRRLAVGIACLMHAALFLLLGPWQMVQQPAVLIWNLFFIWAVITLFWDSRSARSPSAARTDVDTSASPGSRPGEKFVILIVTLAVLLPLLEPFGRFDHWPSWGLYAPRNSRVVVFVEEAGLEKLPESLRAALRPAHFDDPDFDTVAYRLSLSQLSLDELRAPIYPQDRFQVGVALAIANRYQLGENLHVELQSVSDRFTGKRQRRMIDGATALREVADEFWLNAIGSMK